MGTVLRWAVPISLLVGFARGQQDATQEFHKLLDADWEYSLQRSPERASSLGDRRFNDRWTDWSLAAVRSREEHDRKALADLATIDRSKFSPQDQINYDLFRRHKQRQIDEFDEHWYLSSHEGVRAAVRAGRLPSGHAHYVAYGYFEGRSPTPTT